MQEEKRNIFQQLEQQLALYDAQGAYNMELQAQLQQQVLCFIFKTSSRLCLCFIALLQRDATAREVAAHAATSMEVQNLQKQVHKPLNTT